MTKRRIPGMATLLALTAATVVFVGAFSSSAGTAPSSALTGKVSSQEEAAMEGVIVSAKRAGSPITVSVVSNDRGEYAFPSDRLAPGKYAITIRAVGFDLTAPASAELTADQTAHVDLTLKKSARLSSQLSNTEWLLSVPGTDAQKQGLNGCTMCHMLQKALMSRYDADEMAKVVQRMSTHTINSTLTRPQWYQIAAATRAKPPTEAQVNTGRYISSINLSAVDTWQFPLKTLPRPKGKATQVIITTYDLPRADAAPHDSVRDSQGFVWYADFVNPFIGKLDPKTGKVTDYEIPLQQPAGKGHAVGALQMAIDKEGRLYTGTMHQAQVVRFDPKTEKMETWPFPGWNVGDARVTMVVPESSSVDGKTWVNAYRGLAGGGGADSYQVDLKTGKWTEVPDVEGGPSMNAYDISADSKNNMYGHSIGSDYVWKVDAKTLQTKFYKIPTPGSGGRRGHVDSKDRLWFAQYRGNGIGMFDPATEKFMEWKLPTPWTNPYDAQFDDATYAYTGGMDADLIVRLNVQSGELVEYLLPFETNIRHVTVQKNPAGLSSVWVVGQLNSHLVHIEPLAP